MAPKKIGIKGKVLHSQVREIIDRIAKFMEQEAKEGLQIPLKSYRERILAATGISKNTLLKIRKEGREVDLNVATTSFSTPPKNRVRPKRMFTPAEAEEVKSIIYNFYVLEKRSPTIKGILQKMKDRQIDFTGCLSTLSRLIKSLGFRWCKTEDNRKILVEKYDIRMKRIAFLRKMIQYRAEGRNIVYTDETYIHSSHTQPRRWTDASGKELMKPISKGQRLIIVHAGGENGFIPNALLIFKSGSKSGDYHDDMNHANFMKWTETKLLPNLPPNSVLVIDNASYHNVTLKPNITSAALKKDMVAWLTEKDIHFDENLTKAELYSIIQHNKFRFPPVYVLDHLLEQHGHKVLRLPPYHPELNPIEKIWALVKNWVAARNTTFRLAVVEHLTRQRFDELEGEHWRNICSHVIKYEDSLIEKEHLMDSTMDNLRFRVNTGSSEEDWTDNEGSSESNLGAQPIASSDSSD